jgi:hypothetical protein
MGIRHLLVGTVAIAALAVAAPAQAEPYPIGEPAIEVPAGTTVTEGSFQFVGHSFGPNDVVTITISYRGTGMGRLKGARVAPATVAESANAALPVSLPNRAPVVVNADANGDFVATITFTQTGLATITASGEPSGVVQSVTVNVVADTGLPLTGDDGSTVTTAVVVGTAAVIAGALLLWLSIAVRRRGRHSADSV